MAKLNSGLNLTQARVPGTKNPSSSPWYHWYFSRSRGRSHIPWLGWHWSPQPSAAHRGWPWFQWCRNAAEKKAPHPGSIWQAWWFWWQRPLSSKETELWNRCKYIIKKEIINKCNYTILASMAWCNAGPVILCVTSHCFLSWATTLQKDPQWQIFTQVRKSTEGDFIWRGTLFLKWRKRHIA